MTYIDNHVMEHGSEQTAKKDFKEKRCGILYQLRPLVIHTKSSAGFQKVTKKRH